MPEAGALSGVRVLVTRPGHQAAALVARIRTAGGVPFEFPTIAILPTTDPTTLRSTLERLDHFDLAVFVSPNAVDHVLGPLSALGRAWPADLLAACVGPGSARALEGFGVTRVLAPTARYDSEGLLALPELAQVATNAIVIFRGDGGRELLGDTLAARGAHVTYVECYRRVRPALDAGPLHRRLAAGEIDIIISTSTQGLHHLVQMVDESARSTLLRLPVVVLNQAQADAARGLGFGQTLIALAASDTAILEAITTWRAR